MFAIAASPNATAKGKSLRAGKGRRALNYKVRAGVGSAEEKFDQWRSGGA